MARLVVKDNITSGGALAVGKTLRLGGFVLAARSASAPTMMTSQVIKNSLHINSELAEQMNPIELSSLNELLDRIATLGVATDYDRIGLKPDQEDIKTPQVTHEIAVVEEPHMDYPSTLRMNYVRITELYEPDTRSREDMTQTPDLESGIGPEKSGSTLDPELSSPEAPLPLGVRSDQNPDSATPTHPNLNRLSHIRQRPQETVHRYWARFLLVLNRVKDYREEDAISLSCKNCTNKGILNAISRRDIVHFADLAAIVQKYCAMESTWTTQTDFWDNPALTKSFVRTKRANSRKLFDPILKKPKPTPRHGTVLEEWLNGPCKIHSTPDTTPMHSLRACWILRQVAKNGEDLLVSHKAEQNPAEGNNAVLTVFETFASNNRRK